jgi:subtilisin family serine protease
MTGNRKLLSLETLERRMVLNGTGPGAGQAALQSYIVVLNDDVPDVVAAADVLVPPQAGHVSHVYEHALRGFAARLPAAAVNALSKNPNVKYIESDAMAYTTAQTLPRGVDLLDAELNPTAGIGTGNMVDVDVAIIDTGIDFDHPDLNVVGGVRITTSTQGKPRLVFNESPSAYDDANGHGTHVAGIVGARDNDVNYVGVAPGARLWSVGVLNSNGSAPYSQIIAGMDWVTARAGTIEVANMSLGGTYSSAVNEALRRMVNAGIFVSVAAGNDAADAANFSPASEPLAFTVSAVADYDGKLGGITVSLSEGADNTLANFSSYGAVVDAAAPGTYIWSAGLGGGQSLRSGTSMAAPHAAGAAALYIAEHGRATNAAGVDAIGDALVAAGRPMSRWRMDGTAESYDRDAFHEPLIYVGPAVADTTPPTAPTGLVATAEPDGSITLRWNANVESDLIGYEIYASPVAGGPYELIEQFPATLNTETSLDGFVNGSTHYFVVRSLDSSYNESGYSDEASATPGDTLPPGAPLGLAATAGDAEAELSWNPRTEADLAGYNVYRATSTGGPYELVNTSPLASPEYVDDAVVNGLTYYYVVTAVDTSSNESMPSVEVSATPAEVTAPVLSVASISWTTALKSGGRWEAYATPQIHNGSGFAAGVTVTANWGSPVNKTVSSVTGADGKVTFASGNIKGPSAVNFTVTAVGGEPLTPVVSVTIVKGQNGNATFATSGASALAFAAAPASPAPLMGVEIAGPPTSALAQLPLSGNLQANGTLPVDRPDHRTTPAAPLKRAQAARVAAFASFVASSAGSSRGNATNHNHAIDAAFHRFADDGNFAALDRAVVDTLMHPRSSLFPSCRLP